MSTFTREQRTGLAGELLVGATVLSQLGWVYRTQHIADLGIDGEIEILQDGTDISTGRILKIQVKTVTDGEPESVDIDAKHFDYWTLLQVPVVVCSASIASANILWWPATDGELARTRYHFRKEKGQRLEASSRGSLLALSSREPPDLADGLVNLVQRVAERVHVYDPVFAGHRERTEALEIMDFATSALKVLRFLALFGIGRPLEPERLENFRARLDNAQGAAQRALRLVNRADASDD